MDPKAPPSDSARDAESGAVRAFGRKRFESRDLDETRAYIGEKFGERSRGAARRRRFLLRARRC